MPIASTRGGRRTQNADRAQDAVVAQDIASGRLDADGANDEHRRIHFGLFVVLVPISGTVSALAQKST